MAVPSLSRLKATAGETALSPDVRVEQMLKLGMLPQETRCLVCRTATPGVTYFWATCERAFVKKDPSRTWWVLALGWLFLGASWFSCGPATTGSSGPTCSSGCRCGCVRTVPPGLADAGLLDEAVRTVPIYAELLDKYPNAGLALDVEHRA